MVFSINLCFTGLHLKRPPEYDCFLSRKLIITFIHRLTIVFSLLISYFICAMRGLSFFEERIMFLQKYLHA